MKRRREPAKASEADKEKPTPKPYVPKADYAELGVTTNFSFLRGGSHPEEFVAQAILLGLTGVGVADRNTLAGVVRAYSAHEEWKNAEKERARKAGGATPFDEARWERAWIVDKLRLLIGCRLVFLDGTPDILAYPVDRAAYGRLTRLLTIGNRRAPKGRCYLAIEDLLKHAEGLQLIVMERSTNDIDPASITGPDKTTPEIDRFMRRFSTRAQRGRAGSGNAAISSSGGRLVSSAASDMRGGDRGDNMSARTIGDLQAAGARVWIGATALYGPAAQSRFHRRVAMARDLGVPLLATNDALYHHADRRRLHDILTCVRHRTTLDSIGRRLEANAERHLKHGDEMLRLFRQAPGAVHETTRFIDGITFSLDQLKYEYPDEGREGFLDEQAALEAYAYAGARRRFPNGLPDKVTKALEDELALIKQLKYAPYFLTVHSIIHFARGKGILCQGRGSAANSTVCYCLGVTEVNPAERELLFARFLSAERNEPPDIDIDFEHGRREEVMQHMYEWYGRDHIGLAATVISYRRRSSLREVGKAFGLSEDAVSTLSGAIGSWWDKDVPDDELRRVGLDPTDARLSRTLELAEELYGFPRHLSQHTGGFVIARSRLDEIVPIQNAAMEDRCVVEWDKDDLETLKMMKVDCLALGMLTCMKKCFELLQAHYPHHRHRPDGRKVDEIDLIPPEDEAVYRMIQRADTLGVFQIESRAQMSMLPRLRPKEFYDLVIEVAIVRPGPIQGDMVHPYLRRRQGLEKPEYPAPKNGNPRELWEVLHRTEGVPLFQEQAMQIAIVAAEFTPSEADRLRRAMATFKRVGTINMLKAKMIEGMTTRGYERDFAERCFRQIEGFGDYGFPESHAASFAILVYASSWFKCFYPDIFACALLNSQPMGFYAPAQIVRDARDHGVEIKEVDINRSAWDYRLEGGSDENHFRRDRIHALHVDMTRDIRSTHALRMGFRQIKGFAEEDAEKLLTARAVPYDSVRDLWLRAKLSAEALERLADADAFRSIGLDRRQALWAVKGLRRAGDKDDLPLFAHAAIAEIEPDAHLPPMPPGAHVVEDYRHLTFSLKAHPVSFLRKELAARGVAACETGRMAAPGGRVTVGGLVLVRQRPGTASGVIFMTLEDETGIANIIVWPRLFERYRPVVLGSRLVAVRGKLQREAEVVHIVAEHIEDLSPLIDSLGEPPQPLEAAASRAGEAGPGPAGLAPDIAARIERDSARRVLPKGRNFH